ncbi:MAG TPA: TetR/AcrR family transcriptional regulator [Acidimicrobiales bacterium]|jgi:AcrR family transcriptional regulator|nr:TetR/AcrR family transcriptional regulator [Acidimicrobiales bacterium]
MPASEATAKRGPGRPRDLAKRRAIIDATLEVVAEVGYSSLTIDAVAQRAGSNRLLIYRVWDTKAALVRDAIFGSADDLVVPDTGSTLDDLRDFVGQLVDNMRRPAYVMGVPGLTIELLADPALFRDTHRRYIKPAEDGFATILERGRERGEVAGDVDPVVLTRVVSGITTSLGQTARMSVAEIVDVVLQSLVGGFVPLA